MFEWFDRVGYSVDIQRLHDEYPEIQWTTFESWAKRRSWDALLPGPGRASLIPGNLQPMIS
jgi:hypothetical protein